MARRVFFSFHYQDVVDFRANVVRQHWLTKPDRDAAGFFDASLWESARRTGATALKRLINSGLDGTSATCVLIGAETYLRPWVRYEILKSFKKGNKLFGVHINGIRCRNRQTKPMGQNPFSFLGVTYSASGDTATLHQHINGNWAHYTEVDDGPSYRLGPVAPEYRGKGFNFASWFPVYDWCAHDGYNNFSQWVGV